MRRLTEPARDKQSIATRQRSLETLERIQTGESLPTKRERFVNFFRQVWPTIVNTMSEGNAAARELKELRAQEAAEIARSKPFDQDA